jgi:glutathione S-transferase
VFAGLTAADVERMLRGMMKLRSSPSSPFVRKVRIAAAVLGFDRQIELAATDLNSAADPIRSENPLGKIPALIREDGAALYDSRVILEYLDHLAGGGKIIPREPDARFAALRLQALCDGALDAAVLVVYEGRYRPPEMRNAGWVERQQGKVDRALAALEQAPPPPGSPPTVGDIALACLLGYCDLRFDGRWRSGHPGLVAWLARFADAVPAFAATRPEA